MCAQTPRRTRSYRWLALTSTQAEHASLARHTVISEQAIPAQGFRSRRMTDNSHRSFRRSHLSTKQPALRRETECENEDHRLDQDDTGRSRALYEKAHVNAAHAREGSGRHGDCEHSPKSFRQQKTNAARGHEHCNDEDDSNRL